MRRTRNRAVGLGVALTLSLAPLGAKATAPPTDGPTPADLFREGQARADAADYLGAIEKYEAAIARLPDDAANEGTRNRLRVELIRAHGRAFEIDDDATHLTKARVLLDDYAATLDASQGASQEWATSERERIDAALAELEARRDAEPEPEPDVEAAAGPRLEIDPPSRPTLVDAPAPDPQAGRSLLIAGGVLAGLGVGSVILMATGLGKAKRAVGTFENDPAKRDRARSDNQLGNTLGVAGGVAAGVFLTAGAVLLALGAKKKKQRESRTVLAPAIDGEQLGVVLRGRF